MKKVLLSTLAISALFALNASADVTVKSGVGTLKFNGTHYLGYTYHSDDANPDKDVS